MSGFHECNDFYHHNINPYFISHPELQEIIRYITEELSTRNLSEKTFISMITKIFYSFIKTRFNYWLNYLQTNDNKIYMPFMCSLQFKNPHLIEIVSYRISS